MSNRKPSLFIAAIILVLSAIAGTAQSQPSRAYFATQLTPVGDGFTYQGRLTTGGAPANGTHDLSFTLYDAETAGNQVAGPIAQSVMVVTGVFTVTLDFGAAAFNGDARYLQISVNGTPLTPRQPLNP